MKQIFDMWANEPNHRLRIYLLDNGDLLIRDIHTINYNEPVIVNDITLARYRAKDLRDKLIDIYKGEHA